MIDQHFYELCSNQMDRQTDKRQCQRMSALSNDFSCLEKLNFFTIFKEFFKKRKLRVTCRIITEISELKRTFC